MRRCGHGADGKPDGRTQKKLIDAATHWARGGVKDEAADDLAAFGAPPEVIGNVPVPAEDFEVWPENMEVVALFMRLQTQWRIMNGVFVGLNYQSVQFLFDAFEIKDKATMLDDLQAMEASALMALNKGRIDGA